MSNEVQSHAHAELISRAEALVKEHMAQYVRMHIMSVILAGLT